MERGRTLASKTLYDFAMRCRTAAASVDGKPLCYNGVMAHKRKEHGDVSNAAALCLVGLENLGNILLGLPVAAIIFTCLIPPIGGILFLIWLFLLFCIASAVISCIFEDVFKPKSKSKTRANRVRARTANGRFIKTSLREAPTTGQAL
jgi:hypothetical protein